MKKILLSTICSLLFASVAFSQLSVPEPNLVINGSAGDDELYGKTDLINTSSDSLYLRWVRTINDMPDDWNNYFCAFPGLCGLPWTDSLDFALQAGETGELQCHCEPEGVAGIGSFTVDIINEANNEVLATVEITCDAAPVSTNELDEANIKLFPNPATDNFHLINAQKVDQVTIYNILGKQVKAFARNEEDFFVGDLPKGIYMVQLMDLDTDATKTLKLKKS